MNERLYTVAISSSGDIYVKCNNNGPRVWMEACDYFEEGGYAYTWDEIIEYDEDVIIDRMPRSKIY